MIEAIKPEYIPEPNPNFAHRKRIEEAIKENDGYCCCMLEKNEDTFCPCKSFREMNESDFCHCGRYYKVRRTKKICLCGSTKFKDKFIEVAKDFTLKGYIVTMPMIFEHSGDEISLDLKHELDELHRAKIADADIVYIINVGGYIGNSTANEIAWAKRLEKEILYLEKN